MTVEYTDGTKKDIDAVFPDFVSFERTWNRSVTQFEKNLRLTDLAWLAWHAEKRANKTAIQFDPEWIGTVAEITVRDESDAEGETPLPKDQPTG
jgi:hypothetical protein